MKPIVAVLAFVVGAGGGAAAGYLLAPSRAAEATAARTEAAAARTAAKVESDRADGAQKQIDVLTKQKAELEAKTATPTATPESAGPAIDPSVGQVAICGKEIHIGVPDWMDRAKLKKLATTLAELPHDTITLRGERAKTLARQLRAAGKLDVATVNEGIEIVVK